MDDIQNPLQPALPEPGSSTDGPITGEPGLGGAEDPLTIRTAEDILAYVPHALGEWPEESFVAVGLGDGRLGPTLRVDLPVRKGPSGGRAPALHRFADTVADYVGQDSPAGAVLAVYTRSAWTVPQAPPHREVIDAVAARLGQAGIPVLEAWVVGPGHWRTATCSDTACCPWPGASIESLRTSRVGAEMVYRGSSYGAPEAMDAQHPEPPPAAVAAALEAYLDDPERWWDPLVFTAALAAWDEVLSDPRPPGPERIRLLAATLMRPALRDAVLVASAADAATAWRGTSATESLRSAAAFGRPPALPGGVPALQAAAAAQVWSQAAATSAPGASAPGASAPETRATARGVEPRDSAGSPGLDFGRVLMGCTGAAPSWERIARLERVALGVAQMEEPEVRAPALAVLAWVQWARGRGSRCLAFLERSLSVDPGYRLALLLRGLVEQGELAAWARNRDTAWHRAAEAA